MKKFNITVNGKSYEVDVEEIGGVSSPAPVRRQAPAAPIAAPTAAPAPSAAPVVAPAPVAQASTPAAPITGGEIINAPMPGTILDIKVNVGDVIANGAVLLILEAMKMENEIMSPVAGKVLSINVSKGASVNSGDVLVVIG